MSRTIGLDLGTTNTYIYRKGRGIVVREPSVIAIDDKKSKIVSLGENAKELCGKELDNVKAYSPIKSGVISDFDITTALLGCFFEKSAGKGNINRPNVLIAIPYGITEVERLAIEKAATEAGARSVAMIDAPLATALGAELPIEEPRGSMIVNIGGGTTESAVISLGGIVKASSVRVGGQDLDEAITAYLKRKYNLIIGDTLAEKIKIKIASVHASCDKGHMEINGRDAVSGLPLTVNVTSLELKEALEEQLDRITDGIKATLENLPPELASDICRYGITLAGGTSLLGGLAEHLSEILKVDVKPADEPLDCCILGIGKIIEICPELIDFNDK